MYYYLCVLLGALYLYPPTTRRTTYFMSCVGCQKSSTPSQFVRFVRKMTYTPGDHTGMSCSECKSHQGAHNSNTAKYQKNISSHFTSCSRRHHVMDAKTPRLLTNLFPAPATECHIPCTWYDTLRATNALASCENAALHMPGTVPGNAYLVHGNTTPGSQLVTSG